MTLFIYEFFAFYQDQLTAVFGLAIVLITYVTIRLLAGVVVGDGVPQLRQGWSVCSASPRARGPRRERAPKGVNNLGGARAGGAARTVGCYCALNCLR